MSAFPILPYQLARCILLMLLMPQAESVDPLLTREDIRGYHDNDLLQLIAFTDAVMYKRLLTEKEKHNFWLAIDERRARSSYNKSK
jgi:hypothetical protein